MYQLLPETQIDKKKHKNINNLREAKGERIKYIIRLFTSRPEVKPIFIFGVQSLFCFT